MFSRLWQSFHWLLSGKFTSSSVAFIKYLSAKSHTTLTLLAYKQHLTNRILPLTTVVRELTCMCATCTCTYSYQWSLWEMCRDCQVRIFFIVLLGPSYFMGLLGPRLVGVIGATNYAKSSCSQWALSMTRIYSWSSALHCKLTLCVFNFHLGVWEFSFVPSYRVWPTQYQPDWCIFINIK